jgi:hypothetical protein
VRKALDRDGKLSPKLRTEVKHLADAWDAQREEFKRVWLLSNEAAQIDYRLGEFSRRKRDFARVLKPRSSRKKKK